MTLFDQVNILYQFLLQFYTYSVLDSNTIRTNFALCNMGQGYSNYLFQTNSGTQLSVIEKGMLQAWRYSIEHFVPQTKLQQKMKKFEQQLKQKAHLNKIKNAKKTVSVGRQPNKMSSIKSDEAQMLLTLYEKKRFDSIPAYKLLRTAGLQQYTKGFIERGYGVKLGILSALSQKDKNKLYEDIKILPGHAVKLDRLIQTVSKHSYVESEGMSENFSNYGERTQGSQTPIVEQEARDITNGSHRNSKVPDKLSLDTNKLKFNDPQYEKQLQRVLNQYTPDGNEKQKQKKSTFFRQESGGSSGRSGKPHEKVSINFNKLKMLQDKQFEGDKVANQYTPPSDTKDKKKRTFNQKILEKKTPNISSGEPARKYSKTKYVPTAKGPIVDFKKKSVLNSTIENRPTAKKIDSSKQKSINPPLGVEAVKRLKNLGIDSLENQAQTLKIMEINLDIEKWKSLNRSFDGALMSSTIANIDIEQLVHAFSGYVHAHVIAAPEPTEIANTNDSLNDAHNRAVNYELEQSIDDEVGNILRESYLHPLYRDEELIDENIDATDDNLGNNETEYFANSEGEEEDEQVHPHNEFLQAKQDNLKQSSVSSFLGGESYHFGLEDPLQIFNEATPTELDYFKPTADSIANFIKNIVLTAKMEREISIMAAHYLQVFLSKTGMVLTSLNYKRILVTLLLLASKIWDDQSFESPSFSKTFPEYTTILLNQMEKEVLKALDYKLKLEKKEFARIYFELRKYARKSQRSCQNKRLNLQKIRELQQAIKKDYKSSLLEKRNSF